MEGIPLRTTLVYQDDQGNVGSGIINMSSSTTSSHVPETVINITSSQPRFPSRNLLDDQQAMKTLCIPLHKAALRGDWDAAKSIIDNDARVLTSSISIGGQTVLHHAAGTHNTHFVKQLLTLLSNEDLELRDEKKNTALCNAVATAPVEIAQLMMERNPNLATMRGGGDAMPLYMAALFKHSEMAWYLYDKTEESLEDSDRKDIFFTCINSGIFDLALKMLKDNLWLARERDVDDKTALHLLALMPSAFESQSSAWWRKILESLLNFKFKRDSQTTAIELVRCLWDEVLNLGHHGAMELISDPSQLLFDATKLGNFEFLQILVSSYPDLVWQHDDEDRTIFHYAVKYRHARIFSMIHLIGSKKEVISTYEDDLKNNILHLAAMLPPPDRLNTVSGAALQMQKELLWFQEVRNKIPVDEKKTNEEKLTPGQLFAVKHSDLRKQGEKWLKDTSHSGLIVSTIITTVVFAALFSLPGGNSNSGSPNDLRYKSFLIFILSDGLAMLSSVVAGLMFLSILTSRYAEEDFLKSLPLKLMVGLTSLFFSMLTMMIAFSSTVAIACHDKLKWVPYLISMFAFVPIAVFVILQFRLWFDTFSSTFWSMTIFRPPRQMLY